MEQRHYYGIPASPGIAIAHALLITKQMEIPKRNAVDIEQEVVRLQIALQKSIQDLQQLHRDVMEKHGEYHASIFEAQQMMLSDPEFIDSMVSKIRQEHINAEFAVDQTARQYIELLQAVEDEYMKERAVDVHDVSQRVLRHLLQIDSFNPFHITEEVIVITDDLTPSETAKMDRTFVKGFATNIGGRTSHAAILARSLGIPAVVGLQSITEHVQTGDWIILDGDVGKVTVRPTDEELCAARNKLQQMQAQSKLREIWEKKRTTLADGKQIELAANIGEPNDVQHALQMGAEGIGLFRTEFLFLGRDHAPTEEEQFVAYRSVVEHMQEKPVIIRTLDIGGDKKLPYLAQIPENNPFLGVRGIRFCLAHMDLFKTQLRAIIRASMFGDVRILLPMIATVEELRRARFVVEEVKQELKAQGYSIQSDIPIGMMIEVPAAALAADIFASEIDFFSIGTNDLIQYTFASDRMNEHLSYLYQPFHPAILRMIQSVIKAAHKTGKWVGMCGEMAEDMIAAPILVGMGIDELSMNATSIAQIRQMLSTYTMQELHSLVDQVMQKSYADDIVAFVKEQLRNKGILM